jgi:hypothetical protein
MKNQGAHITHNGPSTHQQNAKKSLSWILSNMCPGERSHTSHLASPVKGSTGHGEKKCLEKSTTKSGAPSRMKAFLDEKQSPTIGAHITNNRPSTHQQNIRG